MLHCPSCRYEYEAGTSQCPDCSGQLVLGPLPDPPAPLQEDPGKGERERLVAVARPENENTGLMLRDLLLANGIPATLGSLQMPWYDGLASLTMTQGAWGSVLVRDVDARRADELLREYAEGEAVDACDGSAQES